MKKSLLVIMMSMVMGGLVATPKTAVNAKAEAEKFKRPDEIVENWGEAQKIHESGVVEYPWEYLNKDYEDTGKKLQDFALLETAFYPADDAFNESETYATVTQDGPNMIQNDSVIKALKEVWAEPNIAYSVAFRYVCKADYTNTYSDSDWFVPLRDVKGMDYDALRAKFTHVYNFDYALNNYGDFYVDSSTGRLVWSWETFQNWQNPQADEIEYMEVLVFDGATEEINENSKPLTTFEVRLADEFTYKSDIEEFLTAANLKPGNYKFSARLIARENSKYDNSHLYPLTKAYYYEPEVVTSETNVAKNAVVYSQYGDASAIVDGNRNSRWINGVGDNKTETGWLLIDLGKKYQLATLKIFWEGAFAKDFDVFLVKNIDAENFDGDTAGMKPVASVRERTSYLEKDEFDVSGNSGRYLIISLLARGSGYDYSIYEVEAYINDTLTEVEEFISDWKDLRALGNGDICNVKDSEEMARMLAWYDDLSDDDKLVLDTTDDAMGVSIGDTVRYLKAINGVADDATAGGSLSNMLLNTVTKDKTLAMAVVTFASIAVITVGYYFINKKKYNA